MGEALVALLAAAGTPVTGEAFARDEVWRVGRAQELRFSHRAAYWRQLADPEGTAHVAEGQYRSPRVHQSQTFAGAWVLDGLFDPINGSIVSTALRRIEDELFAAGWAEAKARVGEGVRAADLARAPLRLRNRLRHRRGPPP